MYSQYKTHRGDSITDSRQTAEVGKVYVNLMRNIIYQTIIINNQKDMSRIRANNITNQAGNGAPNAPHGLVVSGIMTALQETYLSVVQ